MSDNPSDKRTQALSELAAMDAHLLDPAPTHPKQVEGGALERAARALIEARFDTYTARNGRQCSIEGDDGEKCWIVPFDAMHDLEAALSRQPAPVSAELPIVGGNLDYNSPALAATVAAFRAQSEGVFGQAFIEDGDTRADQYYIEGSFLLTPIIDAVRSVGDGPSCNGNGIFQRGYRAGLYAARHGIDDDPVSAPTLSDTKEGTVEDLIKHFNDLAGRREAFEDGGSDVWHWDVKLAPELRKAASLLTSLKAQLDEARKETSGEFGWVYYNPDNGIEYAPDHPVDSGECLDAEDIRPATAMEQTLNEAFQREWDRAETAEAERDNALAANRGLVRLNEVTEARAEAAEAELSRVKQENERLVNDVKVYSEGCDRYDAELSRLKQRIEEKALYWRKQEAEWSKPSKDPTSLLVAASARHRAEAFEEAAALSNPSQGVSK